MKKFLSELKKIYVYIYTLNLYAESDFGQKTPDTKFDTVFHQKTNLRKHPRT